MITSFWTLSQPKICTIARLNPFCLCSSTCNCTHTYYSWCGVCVNVVNTRCKSGLVYHYFAWNEASLTNCRSRSLPSSSRVRPVLHGQMLPSFTEQGWPCLLSTTCVAELAPLRATTCVQRFILPTLPTCIVCHWLHTVQSWHHPLHHCVYQCQPCSLLVLSVNCFALSKTSFALSSSAQHWTKLLLVS